MKNYDRPRIWLHNFLSTDHSYFKENYKLTATDLSKHQALDADWSKSNTGKLDKLNNTVFLLIKNQKEPF